MSDRFRVRPFEIEDLDHLDVQSAHAIGKLWALASPEVYRKHMETPYSWTLWHAAGWPIGSAGILPANSEAWAFLSASMKRYMVPFTRAVVDYGLTPHTLQVGPVYARIDPDYEPAIRWAELLGFKPSDGEIWKYDPRSP